jgi:hypothetical protein
MEAKKQKFFWAFGQSPALGGEIISQVVFLKKVLAIIKILRLPISFRPKSSRGRTNSMGGALRRPANSGIGANLQNCSNLFYQKLLTN